MSDENIEETVLALFDQGKWEDIVNVHCGFNEFKNCRLFWVLPTMNDLCWVKELIEKHGAVGLTSIGCGAGLFEWLFQMYSGLEVAGIELDRSWWHSKYSPPLFLSNVSFINGGNATNVRVPENHALLFCYFNNGSAFCEYVDNFKGNLIFVIGPEENQQRWTDPMPFDEKFHEFGWELLSKRKIERTNDYITANMSSETDQNSLVDNDEKNKTKVYCTFCPSKMLNAGAARLVNTEFHLPYVQRKGEGEADQQELVTDYWLVEDIYTFENIGVSHTVDNIKYLACADCDKGPVGWHDLATKKSYIALSRVKHE